MYDPVLCNLRRLQLFNNDEGDNLYLCDYREMIVFINNQIDIKSVNVSIKYSA